MDFGLTNKRAFVGGGSRGIGKAIAIELAREGCDVVIASRTQSALEDTAKEIEDLTGRRIIPLALDVTSREQVDSIMAEGVLQLGGLEILVNSASLPGGSRSAVGPIDELDEDALLSDFDTKYVGALRCARAYLTMRATEEYQAARVHRRAALYDSRLIMTSQNHPGTD